MSKKNNSTYHCGRCGSFFKSSLGYLPDRACTECGRTPLLGFQVTAAATDGPGDLPTHLPPSPTQNPTPKKSGSKRHKRKGIAAQLVIGWLLLLAAIIAGAGYFKQITEPASPRPTALATPIDKSKAQDLTLLKSALPLCNEVFADFLKATTDQEKTQLIHSPLTSNPRFRKFYRENLAPKIDPSKLSPLRSAVLHLPGRLAIESQYSIQDGRLLDAVFLQEDGKWRLDWEHYARFGDSPWSLFLIGSSEETGEFRLLARERNKGERSAPDTLRVLLYASRTGNSAEAVQPSPEFLIKRDSPSGRLLEAAFKLDRENQRPFDLDLPSLNSEDFINVRVKVRRFNENDLRRFELVEVLACHWYSEAATGVDIPSSPSK